MVTFYDIKARKNFLRCRAHNYSSPSIYFITILTKNREHFFGEISDKKMVLSDIGKIAFEYWHKLPEYFPDIKLDEFIIMPNHIHGIIEQPILSREEINSIYLKN